jgi:F-type H+-transporting ATPase subunit b
VLATLLLAAETVEDVKAKNPILPEGDEILWASIAFIIVLSLLAWKAWPAIKAGLKARQDRIAGDLAKAEEARVEAETSLEDYRRQLAEARTEAAGIIEEARQDAERVRQERIAAIDDEIAQLRARAAEDIRLATERAMSDLSTRVSELSIELAEKVVEHNLDRDTQIALIENYINQVGSN